ncbi:MAG: hypothetical protein HN576_10450 [Bacteriovoracaceae bacterium]|nr:hypothetical protein [Bacteriovoracaceae bacterium]
MKILILLVSIVFSLSSVEVFLRLSNSKYRYAAEAIRKIDQNRLFSRVRNSEIQFKSPDTEQLHKVHYNNYGLRSSSDIDIKNLNSKNIIGIFGDSFVENLRLPEKETVSHLLTNKIHTTEKAILALNMGVEGYGTDQAYLYYRDSLLTKHINHAWYFFYHNDVKDVRDNQLLYWKENKLQSSLAREFPSWKKWASKLYLTYLVLDFYHRFVFIQDLKFYFSKYTYNTFQPLISPEGHQKRMSNREKDKDIVPDVKTKSLIQNIIKEWEKLAKKNGAEFKIIVLPDEKTDKYARDIFKDFSGVIYLRPDFLQKYPKGNIDWAFKKDLHWNKDGNELAAEILSKVID